jgi:DNA-directed RNA polymerase subunit RPC12/RpoP
MWDYVCPRCRREVAKNSHKCPHCGERFPFPLKVPPICLKDQKALEDYVHKHIFPRISASQREYLAQFFTIIFSDGFESGNFSAWDGVYTGGVGTAQVVTDQKHHGTYSAKLYGGSGSDYALVLKTFTATNPAFFRLYIYIPSLFTENRIKMLANLRSPTTKIRIMIGKDDTGYRWALENTYTGAIYYSSYMTIPTETWICIELKAYNNPSAGELRLWKDGTEIITQTGLTLTSDAFNEIYIELYEYGTQNWTVYYDCVIVADTYIGPEVAVVTVTDSVGLSDVALCHKTFAVADSVGLTDVPLKGWTPTVTDAVSLTDATLCNKQFAVQDVLSLADAVLSHKQLQVSDTVSLADVALALKILLLTDSISLSDAVEVLVGAIIKVVEDSVGLSDAVYRNKALIISDAVNVLDQVFRNKPLVSISDVLTLAEVIAVSKFFAVADSVSLSDVAKVLKQLRVSDTITIVDAAQVPSKILKVLDSVGLSDAAKVGKVLVVSDQIALVEVVYAAPVRRTKLFLVIGNLAIQLTGG